MSYGYSSLLNRVLLPSTPLSHYASSFFKNFYDCLFQFHTSNTSWEQRIGWVEYDPLLKYYGGISPFTIQSSAASNSILQPKRHESQYGNRSLTRRYSNCSIQLKLPCQDIRDGTATWHKEFVWQIISIGTKCRPAKLETFSSVYFAIYNFQHVFMLCWSCHPLVATRLPKDNAMITISGYLRLWKKLHKTLNRALIGINFELSLTRSVSRWDCNIHKVYAVPVYDCVYFTLLKTLNVTFANIHLHSPFAHPTSPLYQGLIQTLIPLSESTREIMLSRNYDMLPYAMHINPYSYFMVREQIPINWEALIHPFDSLTWIFSTVTIFTVGLMLCLELKAWRGKCSPVNFHIILPTVSKLSSQGGFAAAALLVHQSVSIDQFMKKSQISLLILWCFWGFVAVTLSQFYEGTLFSFLSTTVSPWVPQTLEEILQTKIFMFTQGSGQNYTNGTASNKYSMLRDSILHETIENNPEKNNSAIGELYRKIQWFRVAYTVDTTLEFRKHGWITHSSNAAKVKVPKSFFFIDTDVQVNFLRTYLSIISERWLSKPSPLNLFVNRHGWVIKKNHMYETFKWKFIQLYESGIFDRWDEFFLKHDIVHHVKKAVGNISLGKGQNGISVTNLFHYVYCSEQKLSVVAEEFPIGFDMLEMVILYAAVCIIVSGILFIYELFKH
ncbi:unnamed protein product [Orchesella dallaii]|uniref:Ionotropic glutamate receptor C-terminal domain-containing protein n=1 Tax=Orchesella dallaii TaxID=48710 RepID=A0ABP1RMN9_9HEXA